MIRLKRRSEPPDLRDVLGHCLVRALHGRESYRSYQRRLLMASESFVPSRKPDMVRLRQTEGFMKTRLRRPRREMNP